MSSFPLFRLPLLCQLDIINKMGISTIIALSQCSKRTLGLIQNVNIEMENLRISETPDCEHTVTIALKPRNQDQNDYIIHLEPPAELERKHRRLISERAHLRAKRYSKMVKNVVNKRRRYPTAGGFKIRHRVTALRLCHLRQRTRLAAKRQHAEKVWKWSSGDRLEWVHRRDIPQTGHLVYDPEERFFDACDVILKQLVTLFRRFGTISVWLSGSHYHLNRGIRKWTEGKVNAFRIISEGALRPQAVDVMFRDSLEKFLFVSGQVETYCRYYTGFHTENVHIENAHWVDFAAVWDSTSKTITLDGFPLPTAVQWNALVREWQMKRRMVNIEKLVLKLDTEIPDGYWNTVFKHVCNLRFVAPRDGWEDLEKWMEFGRIVPRIDSKVASLLMVDKTFEFRVRDEVRQPFQ